MSINKNKLKGILLVLGALLVACILFLSMYDFSEFSLRLHNIGNNFNCNLLSFEIEGIGSPDYAIIYNKAIFYVVILSVLLMILYSNERKKTLIISIICIIVILILHNLIGYNIHNVVNSSNMFKLDKELFNFSINLDDSNKNVNVYLYAANLLNFMVYTLYCAHIIYNGKIKKNNRI